MKEDTSLLNLPKLKGIIKKYFEQIYPKKLDNLDKFSKYPNDQN